MWYDLELSMEIFNRRKLIAPILLSYDVCIYSALYVLIILRGIGLFVWQIDPVT